ncbi:hypothetical protein MCAMS1_02029 [biofilm metagenome]
MVFIIVIKRAWLKDNVTQGIICVIPFLFFKFLFFTFLAYF